MNLKTVSTLIFLTIGGIAIAAPTATAGRSAPAHHAVRSPLQNKHLRGVEPVAGRKEFQRKLEHAADHHPWHRRWDYRTWIVLHRGLGMVRGQVYGPEGTRLASARVVLQHRNGAGFAHLSSKHITYTDAQGGFVMFGVHSGRYRVFAKEGKHKGHAQTAVHPGSTAVVNIKA